MSHSQAPDSPVLSALDATDPAALRELGPALIKLADDPWTLTSSEREQLRATFAEAQSAWIPRLTTMTEPPAVDESFPAFLLATRPFAHLAAGVGDARHRQELDTATADELQRFVDRYRSYMTGTGE